MERSKSFEVLDNGDEFDDETSYCETKSSTPSSLSTIDLCDVPKLDSPDLNIPEVKLREAGTLPQKDKNDKNNGEPTENSVHDVDDTTILHRVPDTAITLVGSHEDYVNELEKYNYPELNKFRYLLVGVLLGLFLASLHNLWYSNSNWSSIFTFTAYDQCHADYLKTVQQINEHETENFNLITNISKMTSELYAKTISCMDLSSECEKWRKQLDKVRHDLYTANVEIYQKRLAYEKLKNEHKNLKIKVSTMITELKNLKIALLDTKRSSLFFPGINIIKNMFCRILRLCPDLEL